MWWLPLAVMGGLSMAKSSEDRRNYNQNMKNQAVRERWAPFTGQRGQFLKQPSEMGTMMQGLATGAMLGQGMGGSDGSTGSTGNSGAPDLWASRNPDAWNAQNYASRGVEPSMVPWQIVQQY
jgi:hypothetical protein